MVPAGTVTVATCDVAGGTSAGIAVAEVVWIAGTP